MSGRKKSPATSEVHLWFNELASIPTYHLAMVDLMPSDTSLAAQNRQKIRESIFFGASVLFKKTGEELPVRVRNISPGGMMIDCTLGAGIGDEIVADIKNIGKVTGRVAWAVAPRMGIAFDHEVNPARARLKV
jgi:PilZ domain